MSNCGKTWYFPAKTSLLPAAWTCTATAACTGHYSTYIEGEPEGDVCQELSDAIHHQRTWVCKGPLLEVHNDGEALSFTIHQTGKPG